MAYQRRVLDDELDLLLGALPAVAIDGAKAVGKTSTAQERARSVVQLDMRAVREAVSADPSAILTRQRPLLLDEWQKAPDVWDVVRRAVDEDRSRASSSSPGVPHRGRVRPPTPARAGSRDCACDHSPSPSGG